MLPNGSPPDISTPKSLPGGESEMPTGSEPNLFTQPAASRLL
jgi:hypothetical protein